MPFLLRDKEVKKSVIEKANVYITFKIGDLKFLDIMNLLCEATTLQS